MTTDIEQRILDEIRKNMPEQVGDALRQRLEQADKDAAELERLKSSSKYLSDSHAELAFERDRLKDRLRQHDDLAKREAVVAERERQAEIEHLKMKLAAEESKTVFAKEVALGLVRNTEYRSGTFRGGSREEFDNHGCSRSLSSNENTSNTSQAV